MAAEILVVEDEPAIQELISFNLTRAGYVVRRAHDAEQARQMLSESVPTLAIVDWMLPGQSGISLIRALRANPATQQLPIIMITARANEQDMVLALESGADDYIRKPFSPREVIARIQVILRRLDLGSEHYEIGGLRLDPAKNRVSIGNRVVALTVTEFRLLQLFMRHPERVHTRSSLIDKVWGDSADINERTVDAHVGRLRAALESSDHRARIETVRGLGYCLSIDKPGSTNQD